MVKMNYLSNNEGLVVKNFMVRDVDDASALTFCRKAKDLLAKYGGEMLVERKLLDGVYFIMPSLDSSALMSAWEMTLGRRDIMAEITCTKILEVKDDAGDGPSAQAKCQRAKELLEQHKGCVLREIKVSDSEYRLILFFSDNEQMMVWEKTLNLC